MTVEWPASFFSATLEDDVWLVAFADAADEPEHYLLLQRSTECDEQDAALGQDTYHLEISSPALSGYGGVAQVRIEQDRIIFSMASSVTWCMGLDQLVLLLAPELQDDPAIEQALREVFVEQLTPIRG
ncbi:Imm10 family immunity protein [Pseudomonas sp. QD4]|uniref:Imm10 family immunity protein n=1 Tax=Pseudomonas sp. QD4 TaxID=3368618 RepID=UPI003BA24DED